MSFLSIVEWLKKQREQSRKLEEQDAEQLKQDEASPEEWAEFERIINKKQREIEEGAK